MAGTLSSKITFRVLVLIVIPISLWTFSGTSETAQHPAQSRRQVPVEVKQIDKVGPIIPVELRCDAAVKLNETGELEGVSCVIRNNTSKYITAGTIFTSTTIENGGLPHVVTGYDTFDTFLHADFREDHQNNLIPPGGEYRVAGLPVSYDGASVQGVTVQIDYVEFSDNTTTGANRGGARIIEDIRQGAAIYKNWLARKYDESGRSADALISLLSSDQALPSEELEIVNANQERGATLYLKYMRRTYKAKGAEGLTKHLK